MLAFTFFILKDVLKYTFVTAAVLVYTDIGPGGEHVASLVGMFEDLLLSIDWTGVAGTIAESFRGFMTDADIEGQLAVVEVTQ